MIHEDYDDMQDVDVDADVDADAELREAEAEAVKRVRDKFAKHQANKSKHQAKQEKTQGLLEAAHEFLDQHPRLYFVSMSDHYAEWLDGKWHFCKAPALHKNFAEVFSIDGFTKAFNVAMSQAGRCFYGCTYSFEPVPNTLNLLVRDNWLKPQEGQHHAVFDCIMRAIGGGKEENVEHLERVLAYKIEHPECVTIPAILVNGEGNLGKNLLVEHVLDCVWPDSTIAATAKDIIGPFNSPVIGKMFILMDETSPKRVDHDELKHRLQSQTFTANKKGEPQYKCYNLGGMMISSNRRAGGIYLDRTKADRRVSVFHVDTGLDLYYWIGSAMDMRDAEVANWMDKEGMAICKDRDQVAKWIGHLLRKYGGQDRPRALHGKDHARLMNIQRPPEEDLIPAVFNETRLNNADKEERVFTHINRRTFYLGYAAYCKQYNREPMGKETFFEIVRAYLKANPDLDIPDTEKQVWQGMDKNTARGDMNKERCWVHKDHLGTAKRPNDRQYVTTEGYKDVWVGPTTT